MRNPSFRSNVSFNTLDDCCAVISFSPTAFCFSATESRAFGKTRRVHQIFPAIFLKFYVFFVKMLIAKISASLPFPRKSVVFERILNPEFIKIPLLQYIKGANLFNRSNGGRYSFSVFMKSIFKLIMLSEMKKIYTSN